MLLSHSCNASVSTFSRLHQRLLKSFDEAAISLRHLGNSILEGNLYLRPFKVSNSYTMGCPPVRGDNPRALASGLSNVQVDKHDISILYHLHQ